MLVRLSGSRFALLLLATSRLALGQGPAASPHGPVPAATSGTPASGAPAPATAATPAPSSSASPVPSSSATPLPVAPSSVPASPTEPPPPVSPPPAMSPPPVAGEPQGPSVPPPVEPAPPIQKEDKHGFRPGVVAGGRLGYAIAMGKVAKDYSMSDTTPGVGRLQGDIGYQLSPSVYLGGHLGIGVGGATGALRDECDRNGWDCSVVDGDLGGDFEYNFLPDLLVQPWLGAGIGLESLSQIARSGRTKDDLSAYGFYGSASGGVDFRFGRFAIGPLATFSLGRYFSATEETTYDDGDFFDERTTGTRSVPIDTAVHQWLFIGVRARWYAYR